VLSLLAGVYSVTAALLRWIRLAPEGLVFVLPLSGVALLSLWLGWWEWAVVGVLLTVSVGLFFRDPERLVPQSPGAIVSPADGKVMEVVAAEAQTHRISIFLSVLDVHVNRAPYSGKVEKVVYTPGKFLAAYRREASLVNEANSITLQKNGREFLVRQIAGVIARRIVCRVQAGDVLEKGQRYGLIRFGSRVDLVLPHEAEIVVHVGDRVRGGETPLAFLKEP
jgi:phosphatidylserine decarboxylase